MKVNLHRIGTQTPLPGPLEKFQEKAISSGFKISSSKSEDPEVELRLPGHPGHIAVKHATIKVMSEEDMDELLKHFKKKLLVESVTVSNPRPMIEWADMFPMASGTFIPVSGMIPSSPYVAPNTGPISG